MLVTNRLCASTANGTGNDVQLAQNDFIPMANFAFLVLVYIVCYNCIKPTVKYYTSMSLVFYSISRRASLRESKQNQQEIHDQEVEAEAVSRTKNRTKS